MLTEFLRVFKKPTAAVLAQSELEEAQRQLLIAQSGLDFARSSVNYNRERVTRLSRYVRTGQYDAGTPAVPPLHSDSTGRPDIAADDQSASRRHILNMMNMTATIQCDVPRGPVLRADCRTDWSAS